MLLYKKCIFRMLHHCIFLEKKSNFKVSRVTFGFSVVTREMTYLAAINTTKTTDYIVKTYVSYCQPIIYCIW